MGKETFDFLVGRTVEQVWVWGPCRLILEAGAHAEPTVYVDLHEPCYRAVDGTTGQIDVLRRPLEAGALLGFLNKRVVRAVSERGVLELTFADGSALTEHADEVRESWTVVGDGRVFQCMPGGEVDSW